MYTLGQLTDTFSRHHEEYECNREKQIREHTESLLEEPIPECLRESFSLPMALLSMCKEIQAMKDGRNG